MWFADIGLTAAAVVMAVWAALVTITVIRARRAAAAAGPLVGAPVTVGTGVVSVLLVAQAAVVDAVEDTPGGVVPLDASVRAWFVAHRAPAATALGVAAADRNGCTPGHRLIGVGGDAVRLRATDGPAFVPKTSAESRCRFMTGEVPVSATWRPAPLRSEFRSPSNKRAE